MWNSLKHGKGHKETPHILHIILVSFLFPLLFQQTAHLLHLRKGVSTGMCSKTAGAGTRWFLFFPRFSPLCSKPRTSSILNSACAILPPRNLCTARELTTVMSKRLRKIDLYHFISCLVDVCDCTN